MASLTPLELHERTQVCCIYTTRSMDLIENLQEMLTEMASERPLMSDVLPLAVLRAEYENGKQTFVNQIDSLKKKGFSGLRRTRGDGDCFYRCKLIRHSGSLICE